MGMEFNSYKLSEQEEAIVRIVLKRELRRSGFGNELRDYTNLDLLEKLKQVLERMVKVIDNE